MPLTRGRFIGHEQDRGIVQFSMQDGAKEIPCAISTSAMDDLERGPQTRPNEREAHFTRLRDRVEARAASKYRATGFEGTLPGIVLRSIDFRGKGRVPTAGPFPRVPWREVSLTTEIESIGESAIFGYRCEMAGASFLG